MIITMIVIIMLMMLMIIRISMILLILLIIIVLGTGIVIEITIGGDPRQADRRGGGGILFGSLLRPRGIASAYLEAARWMPWK